MAHLDGEPDKHWAEETSVIGTEDIMPPSPIAANQQGRGVVLEQIDGRPGIAEVERTSQTRAPTFERFDPQCPQVPELGLLRRKVRNFLTALMP